MDHTRSDGPDPVDGHRIPTKIEIDDPLHMNPLMIDSGLPQLLPGCIIPLRESHAAMQKEKVRPSKVERSIERALRRAPKEAAEGSSKISSKTRREADHHELSKIPTRRMTWRAYPSTSQNQMSADQAIEIFKSPN
ncbi:hypothetical protein QAD02_013834 [Eretmocerus hayati]|uniref:Uncharacterized protein n=1 Tax=Eretmocerus hayati TaxID=131215 RepID=A0ACC2P3U9_9HYME|nr:hypothetical protein QAD02_013834 [Eretmocerus hayati]